MTIPDAAFCSARVDGILVVRTGPKRSTTPAQLVIWLPGLSGTKENTKPFLADLATEGFTALSFDPWQHGDRGSEAPDALAARVFGDFRHHMWPMLGQTTLDTYLKPLTHLAAYAHGPAMTFECGAQDLHVPPDGALQFQAALRETYPEAAERLRVRLHAGAGHEVTPTMRQNSLKWFREHASCR